MAFRIRALHTGLLGTTLVVTAALLWSGWRLVDQQRLLDAREARQVVEGAAEAMAADIREALAVQSDRLAARAAGSEASMPQGGIAVAWPADLRHVNQAPGLPFVPWRRAEAFAAHPGFAAAEAAEFGSDANDMASQRYRALTTHYDPALRAGAWLRLARVLRKRGDTSGARTAAAALVGLGQIEVEGIPAELVGMDIERLARRDAGDHRGARRVADDMASGIDGGRWALDRGTAEFYRAEVSNLPRPRSWLMASAVADVWAAHHGRLPSRGLVTVTASATPVLVAWRAQEDSVFIEAIPASVLIAPQGHDGVSWRLTGTDEQHVAGAPESPAVAAGRVDRSIGGGSSWLLQVWPRLSGDAPRARRLGLLHVGLGATLLFVWGAAGLMARTLARESRLAQLQADFVAAVSHEFRSPLTTMRQMVEMLETGRVPDERRRGQYYGVLAGETERLQRLVERLLDFGRIEAGHAKLPRETVDLVSLVTDVVAELQPSARARGGSIRVACEPLVHLSADSSSLRVAIRNLVENAVKYSESAPAVTVSLSGEREQVVISVRDEGVGIPRTEQRAIFGTFVRGRSAVARRIQGTGIGLATVKRVVDAHGGCMDVDSEPGRGSTFTMRLPQASGESGA